MPSKSLERIPSSKPATTPRPRPGHPRPRGTHPPLIRHGQPRTQTQENHRLRRSEIIQRVE